MTVWDDLVGQRRAVAVLQEAGLPTAALELEVLESVLRDPEGQVAAALACFVGLREVTHEGMRGTQTVPAYPTPEDAVRAVRPGPQRDGGDAGDLRRRGGRGHRRT